MNLTLTDLAVARGGVPVLTGVNLSVAAGQSLILRGPNGIGKTTLLRTIAGLQPPLAGEVSAPADAIAYAAHADGLKAMLSVAENLRFWADIYGGAAIAPALGRFDLADLADRPAHSLSAGQKRRLSLARLLVCARPIWVLDEPTVSLDAASVTLFAKAVGDHLAKGGIALIATHVDLGLSGADTLDLSRFRARQSNAGPADMAGAFW